jgi:hypothetical protein
MTKMQQAAYNAQLAAAIPVSKLAESILIERAGTINFQHCASYVRAVQQTDWFKAAFPSHSRPIIVVGGKGVSHADALERRIKIGISSRYSVSECEQACLHELAHIVSPDFGPDRERREPRIGKDSSKGHHHAWRVNFILIVKKVAGKQAAQQLRYEFNQWGLPTLK